jgi:hypothetical protein
VRTTPLSLFATPACAIPRQRQRKPQAPAAALAPARVIQERPGKRRAPIVEHADQRDRFDRLAHVPTAHRASPAPDPARLADIGDRRSDAGEQQLACLGERDAAGGAVHQPHAETLLHVAQPLAQSRRRNALLARGAAKVPGAGNGDEGVEIAKVQIVHCSI